MTEGAYVGGGGFTDERILRVHPPTTMNGPYLNLSSNKQTNKQTLKEDCGKSGHWLDICRYYGIVNFVWCDDDIAVMLKKKKGNSYLLEIHPVVFPTGIVQCLGYASKCFRSMESGSE